MPSEVVLDGLAMSSNRMSERASPQTGERCHEPTILWVVLTDLLTTTLDEHGREGNGEPGEQGRSDPLDGHGQL